MNKPVARLVSFGMTPNKYKAIRTKKDGRIFHSKAEAARYGELKLLQTSGQIRNLELQPVYEIFLNGFRVCKYVADFRYDRLEDGHWRQVVEDVKGYSTALFKLKAKLVHAAYGITVEEVRGRG